MRSPSAKVLDNTCDIYQSSAGRDADGGVQFPYPTLPTYAQVPCTAQAQGFSEIEDQGRITQIVEWKIMFGSFIGLSSRDKIVWTAADGPHIAFVEADRDDVGRGAAFVVRATERK